MEDMTSEAHDLSDDAEAPDRLIQGEAELSDNSAEVTLATCITPVAVNEDECDSVSAHACVDENFNTVTGEFAQLSASIDTLAVDTWVISCENCTTSSDAVASDNSSEHLPESSGDEKVAQKPDDSVVDVTTSDADPETAKLPDTACVETENDESGMPNLLSLTMTLIPDDMLNEPHSVQKTDRSDSDSSDIYSDVLDDQLAADADVNSRSADSASTDMTQEECSSVLIIDGHNGSKSTSAGPQICADVETTDSKSVPRARFMSHIDRRARPVPLPRSKTFRTKSASESMSTASNRSSIPVQYETCSSIQSKVCQTMALGDECESEYLLPVDFSEIYVDHMTVEEWHNDESRENAVYMSSYESDYDVLREVVPTAEGYKILPHGDDGTSGGAAGTSTTVLPSYESDYDLLTGDAWADVSDVDTVPMHRDTEAKPSLRTESGYDLLRDDIWADAYKNSEVAPESGLPSVTEERNLQNFGTWHRTTDLAKHHHKKTLSPLIDVRAEQSII